MNAVDTNILVYAHRTEMNFHSDCLDFLQAELQIKKLAVPYHCLVEFVGICTHPKIFKTPTPMEICRMQIEMLQKAGILILFEQSNSIERLLSLALEARVAGSMIHDARIASTCIENGISVLYSLDRDFSRFPDLKVENPLISK
ncbi:MAG: PIN domain-containing protein [Leptospiraceae bacterium]|nr:PIN domain-containing protein [Leptospiraceae bacterium]